MNNLPKWFVQLRVRELKTCDAGSDYAVFFSDSYKNKEWISCPGVYLAVFKSSGIPLEWYLFSIVFNMATSISVAIESCFPRCFPALLDVRLLFGKFLDFCIKFPSAVLGFTKDLNHKVREKLNSRENYCCSLAFESKLNEKWRAESPQRHFFARFRRENLEAVKFRAAKAVSLEKYKKGNIICLKTPRECEMKQSHMLRKDHVWQ